MQSAFAQTPLALTNSAQPQAQSGSQTVAQAPSPSTPQASAPVPTQTPPPPENSGKSETDESVATIRVPVNEVRVVFTVTDKHGHYIKDLKKNDFKVIDDSKPGGNPQLPQ